MKRRTLLIAAPLAVLVPCEIAEAMKSTFASVAHESFARGEREQGSAMGGSPEAAAANWKAFQDDPEWKSVKAKSEENGKLVEKIDSTFLTLTDFSPRLG